MPSMPRKKIWELWDFQCPVLGTCLSMSELRKLGRKLALFGCDDSGYEHFCGALDLLEAKMKELGAIIVNEPLRIDGHNVKGLRNTNMSVHFFLSGNPLTNDAQLSQTIGRVSTRQSGLLVKATLIVLT